MKGDLLVRASASDIAGFRLLVMGGEPVGVDSQPAPRVSERELELVGKAEPAEGPGSSASAAQGVRITGNIVVQQAAKSRSCDVVRSDDLLVLRLVWRP